MLKCLGVISCWLLLWSSGTRQASPTSFPDTPVITERSVGKAQIGMPVAALKQLYKGCTFTPTHLLPYGFDDTNSKPSGVTVSYQGQKLFIYFADWQTKKKVAGLLAFHPSYKTDRGVHVGSTSGQLKAAFPTVRVVPNMMLPVFQIAFVGGFEGPGIEYIFYKQKDVGRYVVADEPTPIVVPTATISWIQVRASR